MLNAYTTAVAKFVLHVGYHYPHIDVAHVNPRSIISEVRMIGFVFNAK